MNSFILNPMIFFGSLIALFVISLLVAFISFRQDNKDNELDTLLKQEIAAREELEKKAANLQQESDSLKKELLLKEELYHGLKGQYDELEKDFERISQSSQQSTPIKEVSSVQPSGLEQAKQEDLDSKNSNSIIDLLKSLNKTEKT